MVSQKILCRLKQDLSDHQVTWGVGGSYLLQLYNLYSNPNDLDLWIKPTDMPIVKKIFKDYEQIKTDIYLPEEYHYKIKYYNVEVEFVACFIVKPNNEYEFHIKSEPKEFRLENGTTIPCTLLLDWYIIYKLLKREDKADLIKEFFLNNNIEYSYLTKSIESEFLDFLARSHESKIPKQIKDDVGKFLETYFSKFQLSFWDLYEENKICTK